MMSEETFAQPQEMGSDHIYAVLKAIETGEATTRASIARLLGLSRTSLTTIVGTLISLGLIRERNEKPDGRGRPAFDLDLDESHWSALGAEFHSGYWTFVRTNLKGSILASTSRKSSSTGQEAFLEELITGLGEFLEDAPGRILPAIGIGVPGLVDCDRGIILRADDLGWKNVKVAQEVERILGLPALVLNRNRASGLAEAKFGAGKGVHNLVYIGIGTGISAAFLSDGRLLHGSSFSAGEIGHITMDTDGPICGCGKRGCLQVYASGGALARRAEIFLADGILPSALKTGRRPGRVTGEEVCSAAASGDILALDCIKEAAHYLGIAAANIITAYNPDKIVLGGPIGRIEGPLLEMVAQVAKAWAMPHAYAAVSFGRGILGDSVGALGGACRVLDMKLSLASSTPSVSPGP
jgi:glucokinase/transcriptional regulator of PTS gene